MSIGQRIKMIRRKAGLTQAELGEILGWTQEYIAEIEGDKIKPSREFLEKMYEHLGETPNFILFGSDKLDEQQNDENLPPWLNLRAKGIRVSGRILLRDVVKILESEDPRAIKTLREVVNMLLDSIRSKK